jgi:uncharacterized membrane protein
MHYFPLALPFLLILLFLFAFLIILIEIGILEYAYERIGVNRRYVFLLLLLSLLGSYVNIPVAELPAQQVHSGKLVTFYGMRYVIPMVLDWPKTVIAVNLGGAVIPVFLSLYVMVKKGFSERAFWELPLLPQSPISWPTPFPGWALPSPPSFLLW